MSNRFSDLFATLAEKKEGAFVPFVMLGDPDIATSVEIIRTLVAAGADALELGVPFSDPVADGPTIQRSHLRALAAGAHIADCLHAVEQVRAEFPELPIGLLIYGNVPFTRGFEHFYAEFAAAGADAILIPDIPVRESKGLVAAAHAAAIAPVFIAPAQASADTLEAVAATSEGYIYAISRDGVTGVEQESQTTGLAEVMANVQRFNGAPVLLGFGISKPTHVADAIAAGAAGAITGSAITKIIEDHVTKDAFDTATLYAELRTYVQAMKAATRS
ncbi:MAG: tryptophan synthase subunit alpha [Corynebacterium sp.]|nr:tryptophan synthase subunit alpha [Corynebacterium sp.]